MQFNRVFLRRSVCAVASFCAIHSAFALEPFAVRDIRVEGLQRVEAGTIFASLPVRVGDTYSDEKAAASIKVRSRNARRTRAARRVHAKSGVFGLPRRTR